MLSSITVIDVPIVIGVQGDSTPRKIYSIAYYVSLGVVYSVWNDTQA